jgi:hypothetical protein
MNYIGYWYKLDDEVSDNGLAHIRNDNDVVNLIGRILTENRRVLHLYVEHHTDQSNLIEPTDQLAEPSELCLAVGEGLLDAGVEKVVGEDSSDDADYEASSSGESDDRSKLSDYETTDAEDEELYTTVLRGKNKDNVHGKFEWFGLGISSNVDDGEVVPSDSADSDGDMESLSSESDEEQGTQTQRKKKIKYPEFTEHDLKGKIKLKKGLRFPNTSMFKAAIKTYSIQNGFDFVYKRNDKIRVTAVCKLKCGWRIHASWSNTRDSFQIKTFKPTHNCGTHHENKKANVNWISNHYLENFRDDPTWTEYALREQIKRDYNITIPRWYRAKKMAMKKVYGNEAEHYKNSRDYAAAVQRWNPGSMCGLLKNGPNFHRMFVCLDACKERSNFWV